MLTTAPVVVENALRERNRSINALADSFISIGWHIAEMDQAIDLEAVWLKVKLAANAACAPFSRL